EAIKVLVARAARHAKVRNRGAHLGLAGGAGPRGEAERRDQRRRHLALAAEAREPSEAFRARLASAAHVDGSLGRALRTEAAERAAEALRAVGVGHARSAERAGARGTAHARAPHPVA